jgi:hypothetical protein
MNNQEARFILEAYRPDGRDASEPMFTEALAQAERDPELRAWFDRQRKFDATVAAKLREFAPPAELRGAILAGVRASQPRPHWWTNPRWLAVAAAIAVLAAVSVTLTRSRHTHAASELAAFAINDLANAHDQHVGQPPSLAGVQAQLADAQLPLTAALGLDLDELRRKNCRSVSVGGREVFEICFKRDGAWYHLYAARRVDFPTGVVDAKSMLTSRGEYASTAWADSKNVYALVTKAGPAALRRLI